MEFVDLSGLEKHTRAMHQYVSAKKLQRDGEDRRIRNQVQGMMAETSQFLRQQHFQAPPSPSLQQEAFQAPSSPSPEAPTPSAAYDSFKAMQSVNRGLPYVDSQGWATMPVTLDNLAQAEAASAPGPSSYVALQAEDARTVAYRRSSSPHPAQDNIPGNTADNSPAATTIEMSSPLSSPISVIEPSAPTTSRKRNLRKRKVQVGKGKKVAKVEEEEEDDDDGDDGFEGGGDGNGDGSSSSVESLRKKRARRARDVSPAPSVVDWAV
ncbi:MAG: hypothetical protein Q9216_004808 [Gyalolechia sp. 2 TL-2023]